MRLEFDNALDEEVIFTETETEEAVAEEAEVQTEWLGQILTPIKQALAQDVPPLIKTLIVVAILLVAVLLIALLSGAIYAVLTPLIGHLLPLVGAPLFLAIMAVIAVIVLGFLAVKGWSWVKDLPKRRREKTLEDAKTAFSTLWTEGKRLIEF